MRHGGVGLFVKHSLFSTFDVSIIDRSIDGILGVLFTHKVTEYKFIVFSCNLPPEDSPWGRDSTSFYGHLLSLIYFRNYVDCYFVCGDSNGRTGSLNDYINDVDELPARVCIDSVKNPHGESFVDFLLESRMCITNGRVTPEFDDFTSVSTKGRAVVDYIAASQECVQNCVKCEVLCMRDVIERYNLQGLIGLSCRPPDHSAISLSFSIDNVIDVPYDPATNFESNTHKRYRLKNILICFMSSAHWEYVVSELISKIENTHRHQAHLDDLYQEVCHSIFTEMDQHIKYSDNSKPMRKKFKNFKPYWSEDLSNLWQDMSTGERDFRKCPRNSENKTILHHRFKSKRAIFDKSLRQAERPYNRRLADDIEYLNTNNPTDFWNHIKRLGPKMKKDIPMKVRSDDDTFSEDIDDVLNTWKSDFDHLYNEPDPSYLEFDDTFLHYKISERIAYELNTGDDTLDNELYNSDFSSEGLDSVCTQLKNAKAVGPDIIPNEVLKHIGMRAVILPFVNKCFNCHIIPSSWQKAIISPIPKSASKDPYVPLNYRGISLLSCFYKIYSCLISNRVSLHCENNGLIVDEQNGFRANRSCLDHIFSICSVIRNSILDKLNVFAAFIDMRKAFDWVNRDLLLYKIIAQFGITGKLYKAIHSIYSFSEACVRWS